MDPHKGSPNGPITLGLKRKLPEFGSTRTFKMACTNGGGTMPIYSCHQSCSYCCSRPSSAAANYLNFLRSMTPRRIMFYSGGKWSDFPEFATSLLVKAFMDRKSAVEISLAGSCYLFDFLSMVLINIENGGQHSVSWIDESDKCFFPAFFFDEDCTPISCWKDDKVPANATNTVSSCNQSEAGCAQSKPPGGRCSYEVAAMKTEVIEDAVSDTTGFPGNVKQVTSTQTLCSELVELEWESTDFTSVMETFLLGLRTLADPNSIMEAASITRVYRYSPTISSALTRQENFEQLIISTRCRRGDANVRRGWFGTSREGATQILLHGFGRGTEVSEGGAYGSGVYLMPENHSFAGVKYCDVDENGEQYMVLCQVVMGNMEKVPEGSKQYSPSTPDFDSGVDDLLRPNCYVVWGAHMVTHIHAEYIVCFRMSPTTREYMAGLKDVKGNSNVMMGDQENVSVNYRVSRPKSPWISFTSLFAEIKDKLPPSAMELLNLHHKEFMSKITSRDEFIRKIRLIAGDAVLKSVMTRFQQNCARKPTEVIIQSNTEVCVLLSSRSFLREKGKE